MRGHGRRRGTYNGHPRPIDFRNGPRFHYQHQGTGGRSHYTGLNQPQPGLEPIMRPPFMARPGPMQGGYQSIRPTGQHRKRNQNQHQCWYPPGGQQYPQGGQQYSQAFYQQNPRQHHQQMDSQNTGQHLQRNQNQHRDWYPPGGQQYPPGGQQYPQPNYEGQGQTGGQQYSQAFYEQSPRQHYQQMESQQYGGG